MLGRGQLLLRGVFPSLELSVDLRALRRYRARQLFGKKLICFSCFARPRLRRPSPTARGRAKQEKQISFLPNKCARRSPAGATRPHFFYRRTIPIKKE